MFTILRYRVGTTSSNVTLGVNTLSSTEVTKEIQLTALPTGMWFDPSGNHLNILSNNTISMYSTKDWKPLSLTEPISIAKELTNLDYNKLRFFKHLALTFGTQGEVLVLDQYLGREMARLKGHNASGQSLAVDWEKNEAVAAYADGSVRRWRLDFERKDSFIGKGKAVPTPDATTCWIGSTCSSSNTILARELDPISGMSGSVLAACPPTISHSSGFTGIAFSPDGNRVAISTSSSWGWGRWHVFDRWTGMSVHVQKDHQDSHCIGWSQDGRWIVVGYEVHGEPRGIVRIFDAETFREVKRIDNYAGQVTALVLSPDSQFFVVACQDGTLSSWSLPAGELIHRSESQAIREHLSGAATKIECRHRRFDRWLDRRLESSDREERARKALHGGPVKCLAFTPDGRRVFTGSEDKTVRVLDTETGREILMFPMQGPVEAMHMTRDGKRLCTSAGDLDLEPSHVRTAERNQFQTAFTKMQPIVSAAIAEQKDIAQLRNKFEADESLSVEEKDAAQLILRANQTARVASAYTLDNAYRLITRSRPERSWGISAHHDRQSSSRWHNSGDHSEIIRTVPKP